MQDQLQQAADHRKGLLITAIGGLILTIDIPLIKLSQGEAWSVLATRGGLTFFAGLVMWAGLRVLTSNREPVMPGRAGLLVTALYGIAAVSFTLAVFYNTTANLVFILAFNPMFAALMGWLLIGERPKRQTFVAMAAMIIGVGLIVSDGLQAGNMLGNLLALFTSLMLALIITISRKARTGMGFAPLFAAIVPCMVGLIVVGGPSGIVLPEPGWLVLNGLIVIPVAFWCLATGPKYISGPEVAMFYLLETILAPVWMWLIFAEAPTRLGLVGGMIIVTALVAHSLWQLSAHRRAARSLVPRHPL
ncbi:putative permease [Hoeflea phototrophica DFL-43]|uniref:Putative permease n=1 Tax=Hoeflea phototrophica (strain DSM 17068 / NCIMB 14078 / DFL-43) TaxID=411684 RepID=A9D4G5_HOEPD|nr:DMT family transporter [Hoeflea phototrophica]EDQ33877.1 putative permease [Hoeflea phototrophica DFL-43]